MEYTGFEPVASTMRMWRAPNCANTPFLTFGNHHVRFPHGNNGARTHDLPLVRRALSQLSYVSTCRTFNYVRHWYYLTRLGKRQEENEDYCSASKSVAQNQKLTSVQ